MYQVTHPLRCLYSRPESVHLHLAFLAFILFACSHAYASRADPRPVDPVVRNGIRYEAPNTDGANGIVVATSVTTGRELWRSTVYTVAINPARETDVQWVFIRSLGVDGSYLDVTDELGGKHRISLSTGEPVSVDRITMREKPPRDSKVGPPSWRRTTTWVLGGALAFCVVTFLLRRLSRRRQAASRP